VISKAPRVPWTEAFPDVVTHVSIKERNEQPDYTVGKSGGREAASRLITQLSSITAVDRLKHILGKRTPLILPVYAVEISGTNVIPDVFAHDLARLLDLTVSTAVVQMNIVGHTRADGFTRLARPAQFIGPVDAGCEYLLVDDHVGMGGTLANLRGHIETNGGSVALMTTLTQSRNSHHIALTDKTLHRLREKHGGELERYWLDTFGYGLDALTEPEAGYLFRTPDVERIRARIAAAQR
jgi:hypothetical protein